MINLLRRLLGGPSAPLAPAQGHVPAMPSLPTRIIHPARADAVLEVVGESHRQGALEQLSGGRTEDGANRVDHVAVLVPDPTNPFDPNAVAVFADGLHVGYLSRIDAELWNPVVNWAVARGVLLGAQAALIGGWDRGPGDRGSFGIVLHLGTPSETFVELVIEELQFRSDHPWRSQLIAFTGDSTFRLQGLPIDRAAASVLATRAGMQVHPRVTKKVQLLIDCDESGVSGNQAKAQEYGIRVVREAEFWSTLGIPVEQLAWGEVRRQPATRARPG